MRPHLSRWEYFRDIQMPAARILWRMEEEGLRVDEAARERHRVSLTAQQAALMATICDAPVVIAAVAARIEAARLTLDELEARRSDELMLANAPILAARAADKKLKGTRLVRRSTLTASIAKARTALVSASEGLNPGSSRQKAWLLYDVLRLPRQYDPKTRAVTTGKAVLTKLARLKATPDAAREILDAMVAYEHADQILGFVKMKADGGRIYPPYGAHRTATGRFASGGEDGEKTSGERINAQNLPKSLRDMFVPDAGNVYVQGDWSKIEWLLTFHLAGDETGLQAALAGEDQHKRLAASIYNVAYEAVTDAQRTHAKRGTHGINYGMGAGKLADVMGISTADARSVIAAFKAAFPLVAKWREETCALGYKQHYLETAFGWRRWFPSPHADVPAMIAFLPSATGADLMKVRLVLAAKAARALGGRLAATTHDSFLAEVPAAAADAMAAEMTRLMELPFSTLGGRSFPADVRVGADWKAVS